MTKPARLPGRNIEGKIIINTLSDYLQEEQRPFELKKQVNESKDRIRVSILFAGEDTPILITLIKRLDGTVSISIADNELGSESMSIAQKIRDVLYDRLDFGRPKEPFFTRRMPIADYFAIESLLDSIAAMQPVEKNDNTEHCFAQYLLEDEKLTIHYYKKRHNFLAQFGSKRLEKVINEALQEATGFVSNEEFIKRIKEGERTEILLKPSMINGLGEELYNFFRDNNNAAFDTLISSYQDMTEKRVSNTRDYSSTIQSICRCYEALMKTLFSIIGLPKEKYVMDYMGWNKKKRKHYLKHQYLDMDNEKRYRLGKLYDKAFGKYRNDVSHGGPPDAHFIITDYYIAEAWFENVVNSMRESYALLIEYIA